MQNPVFPQINRTSPTPPPGSTVTLHAGRVVQTGALYSLVELDMAGMPRVRIDHPMVAGKTEFRVGDRMYVGPLSRGKFGMQAAYGFPETPPPAAAAQRRRGTIHRVHQTRAFGEIIADDTGESIFIHFSELCDRPLQAGLHLSFEVEVGPRGPKAVNAWVE